ncbi:MAG: PAS domain S-box protein, partial [Methanolinea sp.]
MISVLYVDDEPSLLDVTKHLLEHTQQISVDTAVSAAEGLEMIAQHRYDVVVSDYQMPGMDGIGFLRAIRELGLDVPFIIFTGKGREEVAVSAFESGADFYVQKGGDVRAQFAELERKITLAHELHVEREARREQEERLRQVVDFLPDATFAIDTGGRVIIWNRAMEKMTGIGAREILGKGDFEYSLPFYGERRPILIDLALRDYGEIRGKYAYVRREGDSLVAETFIPHLGGGEGAYLWGIATTLRDTGGRVIGAIESIRDISTWKAAEAELVRKNEELQRAYGVLAARGEELRQNLAEVEKSHRRLERSERRFRQLFEAMHEGLALHRIVCDGEGRPAEYRILAVNQAFERILGLRREDVVGKLSCEAYGVDTPPFLGTYAEVAESGIPCSFEAYYPPLRRHFRISVYSPAKNHFATVFEDITERVLAEREKVVAEKRLRDTIRLSRVGFWEYGLREERVTWSPELREILGLDPGVPAPPPADLPRFFTPEGYETFARAVGRAARDGESYDLELEMVRADGVKIWARAVGGPVRGADGSIAGVHGTFQDITEEKNVQEALKRANRELSLLSRITRHDIQNSVMAARGLLEMMEGETPEGQRACRARLGEVIDRISRQTPFITNVKPCGTVTVEELYHAGGIVAVMKELEPLLDTSVMTANAKPLAENLKDVRVRNRDVIRPLSNPVGVFVEEAAGRRERQHER